MAASFTGLTLRDKAQIRVACASITRQLAVVNKQLNDLKREIDKLATAQRFADVVDRKKRLYTLGMKRVRYERILAKLGELNDGFDLSSLDSVFRKLNGHSAASGGSSAVDEFLRRALAEDDDTFLSDHEINELPVKIDECMSGHAYANYQRYLDEQRRNAPAPISLIDL